MEEYYSLCWVLRTTALTTLLWLPYIANSIFNTGIGGIFKVFQTYPLSLSAWAERAKNAHRKTIDSLVLMAIAVVIAHITIPGNEIVEVAAITFFFSRVFHYIFATLGIIIVQALAFMTSFACQLAVISQIAKTIANS